MSYTANPLRFELCLPKTNQTQNPLLSNNPFRHDQTIKVQTQRTQMLSLFDTWSQSETHPGKTQKSKLCLSLSHLFHHPCFNFNANPSQTETNKHGRESHSNKYYEPTNQQNHDRSKNTTHYEWNGISLTSPNFHPLVDVNTYIVVVVVLRVVGSGRVSRGDIVGWGGGVYTRWWGI